MTRYPTSSRVRTSRARATSSKRRKKPTPFCFRRQNVQVKTGGIALRGFFRARKRNGASVGNQP